MMYFIAKFAHLAGLAMIAAGLIGVFVTDMRSRQLSDLKIYAEVVRTSSVFYRGLVTPGGLLLLASGWYLTANYYNGWNFIEIPWLAGMIFLFAYEFIEGNTLMRVHYRKLHRYIRESEEKGYVTEDLQRERDDELSSFSHFLDVPNLMVIVSLGAIKPATWTHFIVGVGLALTLAIILNYMLPRLYPWQVNHEEESDFSKNTRLSSTS